MLDSACTNEKPKDLVIAQGCLSSKEKENEKLPERTVSTMSTSAKDMLDLDATISLVSALFGPDEGNSKNDSDSKKDDDYDATKSDENLQELHFSRTNIKKENQNIASVTIKLENTSCNSPAKPLNANDEICNIFQKVKDSSVDKQTKDHVYIPLTSVDEQLFDLSNEKWPNDYTSDGSACVFVDARLSKNSFFQSPPLRYDHIEKANISRNTHISSIDPRKKQQQINNPNKVKAILGNLKKSMKNIVLNPNITSDEKQDTEKRKDSSEEKSDSHKPKCVDSLKRKSDSANDLTTLKNASIKKKSSLPLNQSSDLIHGNLEKNIAKCNSSKSPYKDILKNSDCNHEKTEKRKDNKVSRENVKTQSEFNPDDLSIKQDNKVLEVFNDNKTAHELIKDNTDDMIGTEKSSKVKQIS